MTEDKVYFSCGSDSSTNGDTLYIPCNGIHNVRIKVNFTNDTALSGITVPLVDHCYSFNCDAYLDAIYNNYDLSFVGSRIENWPFNSINIIDRKVLYAAVAFLNPSVDPGEGLFATMIYTVKDTGRICLDSLFFPPSNDLEFVSTSANDWTPNFYADTFVIAARSPNSYPNLTLPLDVDTNLCTPQTLCIPGILAADPNAGNTIILEKIQGSGTFIPDTLVTPDMIIDTICFLPADKDSTYMFVFKLRDQCPAEVYDTFYVAVNMNERPVLTAPNDVDTFLCKPQLLCIDSIIATDPNIADSFILKVLEGPGTFSSDTGVGPDSIVTNHCFTPTDKDSTYRFIFEVMDSCGETDRDTFDLTVNINEPPQISAPENLWIIENSSRTDTFTAADPDSNSIQDSAGVSLDPDCGDYSVTRISDPGGASGEWEISYEDTGCVDSVFTMIIDVRDTVIGCVEEAGYDTIIVIVRSETSYNNPPIIFAPRDTVGRTGDILELFFMAADPDSDVILDTSRVSINPVACGSTSTEGPSGMSSGEWKVTFYSEGCSEGVYWIDLNLRDFLGKWGWDSVKVTLQVVDVPETSSTIVSGFNLGQNYPNPFNASTEIHYCLPYQAHVELCIFNIFGQKVKTLVNQIQLQGYKTASWNGKDTGGNQVSSGIYFYKLKFDKFSECRKMVLLK
jgi:hypothetical protein